MGVHVQFSSVHVQLRRSMRALITVYSCVTRVASVAFVALLALRWVETGLYTQHFVDVCGCSRCCCTSMTSNGHTSA